MEVTLPTVVVPGHNLETEKLPKQQQEVAAILQSQGREVRVRHSQSYLKGVEFKSGARKGDKRPDKRQDNYAIGTVDYRYPVVYAVWLGEKNMEYARVRWDRGRDEWIENVTTLKKRLREEHNAPEEVASL